MLDVKLLRQSLEQVAIQLAKRGFVLDQKNYQLLEEKRKNLQIKMQELQNERNVRSKAVGLAKAQGQDTTPVFRELKSLSDGLKQIEEEYERIQKELDDFLLLIPNLTHESVPDGKSENDNQVVRVAGALPQFDFEPQDHVALGEKLGQMDFEIAAKMSGSRFVVLRHQLARLQRALIQFMLDLHTSEHGYEEIAVPYLVNADCLLGTGQLPKLKEDLFTIADGKFFLIPTSESPVTNTVRGQIIDLKQLPLKYVCHSSCFRSEAGSYGKDIRGMLRQHQFEKVELVQIVHPEYSYHALEELTKHAEKVLQRLELPYRVVSLCTADIGFAAAKTYDLEVWLPGQQCYREISSCSNTEAFQARRMKARFKDEQGKIDFVHTLNGSGLAVGRTLIAIVENYQDALGRIHIPKALQPFMGGVKVIE